MNARITTPNATSLPSASALPDSWVSKIFSRLEGRYGSLFLDRWRGCDMTNVRATWAEELACFRDKPEAIAYALKSLAGQQFPPTLPEFLSACRRAPEKETVMLPHRQTAADHERAQAAAQSALSGMRPKVSDGIDRHWATHPRSVAHLRMIFDSAERDQRFKSCIDAMVERRICTEGGVLLKFYRNGQWVPILRAAA